MSTAVADAGGVVVISQVRPQSDQGNGPEEGETGAAPTSMPKQVVTFYRGEPEVLGTAQIFTGILFISIGILTSIVYSRRYYFYMPVSARSGIAIWSGILCIISGSLTISASVKPTVGKVKSGLVMNIFSTLAAACGIILAILDLLFRPYYLRSLYCAHYNNDLQCIGAFRLESLLIGITFFTLMLFLMMFCITISTSVFGCKTVCRSSFNETVVVIYQTPSLNVPDTTKDCPPDSPAALTSALKSQI
ncbi:membrane-spanning 4-domains subfamily A member 4A-like isoform X1 [Phyllobates terribilis]|uniref:membrane-spanning 4-domains subfamily A member 4A-like isoform X1 n=1 Tax=Phyllobates terribilis TaxID=111132 RepID=UPI003CCB4F07